jgi:hypothetical protein
MNAATVVGRVFEIELELDDPLGCRDDSDLGHHSACIQAVYKGILLRRWVERARYLFGSASPAGGSLVGSSTSAEQPWTSNDGAYEQEGNSQNEQTTLE